LPNDHCSNTFYFFYSANPTPAKNLERADVTDPGSDDAEASDDDEQEDDDEDEDEDEEEEDDDDR
jgi:hypothetical protein